jgi:hypothetical protein
MPIGVDLQLSITIPSGAFSAADGSTHFGVKWISGPGLFTFKHVYDNISGITYEVVTTSSDVK